MSKGNSKVVVGDKGLTMILGSMIEPCGKYVGSDIRRALSNGMLYDTKLCGLAVGFGRGLPWGTTNLDTSPPAKLSISRGGGSGGGCTNGTTLVSTVRMRVISPATETEGARDVESGMSTPGAESPGGGAVIWQIVAVGEGL